MSEIIKLLLLEDAYWKVNKSLVKEIGIEPTVLLTDIIEKFYYYKSKKQTIVRDGKHWFYYRSEDIKDTFTIGYKVQKRILADLTDRGIIVTKLFSNPAKLHIHFIENVVENILISSLSQRANLKDKPKSENKFVPNGETDKEHTINNSLFNNNEDIDVRLIFIKEFNIIRKGKFKLIGKVKTAFKERMKDGYTYKDMLQALKNAMLDKYHIENHFNDLTPEFITRADKLEKYLNYQAIEKKQESNGVTLTF